MNPIPKPTIDEPVIEGDAVHLTGTGVAGYWVAVTVKGSGFGLGEVDEDGKWKTQNPFKLIAGEEVSVRQRIHELDEEHQSDPVTTIVQASE